MQPLKRFKRPTLLVIGCGDVGMRVLRLLRGRWRLLTLTHSPARLIELRASGATPLCGNLDNPSTLARLAGLADAVLHLAPPPGHGNTDTRTQHLLQALGRSTRLQRFVYASTSGVYGNCDGACFDETRPLAPSTARAVRRVDAEQQLRGLGRRLQVQVTLLRIPGIYASNREGGHPRERLARGAPVLMPAEDVYTNHVHADDLARACVAALYRGRPQRVVHVCDDTHLKMGDYFDVAADLCSLPRPARVSRAQAEQVLSPMQLSFMSESRRLINQRLKTELRLKLRYPSVTQGLIAS